MTPDHAKSRTICAAILIVVGVTAFAIAAISLRGQ